MRKLINLIEQAHQWPPRIEGWELASMVQDWHHTPDDFYDGDIQYNIESFGYYDLKEIPIAGLHLDMFTIHDDLVDDYASLDTEAPPIVYDPTHNIIIDGNHRANAAVKRGEHTILAYVGDPDSYDPSQEDDEADDEADEDHEEE